MIGITVRCKDHAGKTHAVPVDKLRFRISAYGIFVQEKAVLMVQDAWMRKWEFPGGGIHVHEAVKDGLVREYREETGLTIAPLRLFLFQEDFFWATDRQEGWHSLRLLHFVRKIKGNLRASGNGDDVIRAQFQDISGITRQMVKPDIWTVIQRLNHEIF